MLTRVAVARKRTSENGHDRLGEALATPIQNQAAFDRAHAKLKRERLELKRQTHECFTRIEAQMAEIMRLLDKHSHILAEHSGLLERLPEAICDKIGFKAQQ